jgi:hypothetical protein
MGLFHQELKDFNYKGAETLLFGTPGNAFQDDFQMGGVPFAQGQAQRPRRIIEFRGAAPEGGCRFPVGKEALFFSGGRGGDEVEIVKREQWLEVSADMGSQEPPVPGVG